MNNEEKILALLEGMQADMADMKTDVADMKTDVAGVKTDVAGVKTDVAGVKADVSALQTDMTGMKTDMASMKTQIEDLEKGQQAIRSDIARVNHTLEPKINAVYDGLVGILRRNEQTDRHEATLEEHDHRIFALEQVIKQ